MFDSPLFDRAAGLLRRLPSLLVVLSALTLAACGDDNDDPSGPGNGVTGTWETEGVFVRITSSEIHIFSDTGSCYARTDGEIIERDGDVFTVDFDGEEIELEIRRTGDNLTFSNGMDDIVLEPSTTDVDDLEICAGPELPVCSTLPEIEFGFLILGELEASDPVDQVNAHYDLYRIMIDGTQPDPAIVTLDADFDTYLILFDANGNVIAENDDWDETSTNSRIDVSEPDGCYIVMATSFDGGVTGGYEVGFF